MGDYEFATRAAQGRTNTDDEGGHDEAEVDALREQVERLTEEIREIAEERGEDVNLDGNAAGCACGGHGGHGGADATESYVSSAGAFNQLNKREEDGRRRPGRMADESGGRASNVVDDADTEYVASAGALSNGDDE